MSGAMQVHNKEVCLVNLTPHVITISEGEVQFTIPPEPITARITEEIVPRKLHTFVTHTGVSTDELHSCKIYEAEYGPVSGLPDPEPNTIFIVSKMVRDAVPHRTDVMSPGNLIRDNQGRVFACEGLIANFPHPPMTWTQWIRSLWPTT